MKIEAKHVPCTEIFVAGQSIGTFREESQWNGLTELRRVTDGLLLVIGSPECSGFAQIFGRMWGSDEKTETYLVNGSPDLIHQINSIVSEKADGESQSAEREFDGKPHNTDA
ncbi:MAG: hypothetical protein ABF296_07525 [Oceanococcaceae bacterium]